VLLLPQLTVIQGDIVRMDSDAIVHPTNWSLSFGGEIGQYVKSFVIVVSSAVIHKMTLGIIFCSCIFCLQYLAYASCYICILFLKEPSYRKLVEDHFSRK